MTVSPIRPHPTLPLIIEVSFRILDESHAQQYKAHRTAALASEDNRFLVAPSKPITQLTDDEWRKTCSETLDRSGKGTNVVVGALVEGNHGSVLIGSSVVQRWEKDPFNRTAYYRAIFVNPSFRETGVGERIELLQDDWARAQGYTDVVLTVRADKERWLDRQINRFGASIIDSEFLKYGNGETALTYVLKRDIRQVQPVARPLAAAL